MRLYGTGYPTQEVMDITGCSRTSLMDWCRAYRAGGVEALVDKRVGGNRARLTPAQLEDLRTRLRTYTPGSLLGPAVATVDGQFWTVPDLQRAVQQWYGVNYQSCSSYYRLFDLCEFSYQRPARVYKSRSAVQAFFDPHDEDLIKSLDRQPMPLFMGRIRTRFVKSSDG